MHKRFLLSGVLLCLCLGCGTGEYESRIGQHRAGSVAAWPDLLGPAEEIAGTRVSIHAPRCMTLLPQGTDPKRAKPIPMPGVQPRIYEGFVKDSTGGEIPFYCYFVVLEMPKVPGVNLADMMKSAIAKMPGSPQMTEVQATSPEGKESKWQMVHGPEKDEFYYKKDGKDTLQPMDAIDEMYHHEEAGVFVIIAWRLPASIEKNIGDVGLTDLAKAVAGGVSVKPQ